MNYEVTTAAHEPRLRYQVKNSKCSSRTSPNQTCPSFARTRTRKIIWGSLGSTGQSSFACRMNNEIYKNGNKAHTPKNKEKRKKKSRTLSEQAVLNVAVAVALKAHCNQCTPEVHSAVHMIRTRSYLPRAANWSRGTPAPYQYMYVHTQIGVS